MAVLGKVLSETWQAGFVAVLPDYRPLGTTWGPSWAPPVYTQRNNIFVSFAFGSVSALGVHLGLESALGVHSVSSSWGVLGETWQAGFAAICPTTAHSAPHGGPPGHRRFTINENKNICQLCFWLDFGFWASTLVWNQLWASTLLAVLGEVLAKRGKQGLWPFALLPPTRHYMGALLGSAGLHSMKTKYLSALLLARFRFWASTLVRNQLWASTLLAVLGEVLG